MLLDAAADRWTQDEGKPVRAGLPLRRLGPAVGPTADEDHSRTAQKDRPDEQEAQLRKLTQQGQRPEREEAFIEVAQPHSRPPSASATRSSASCRSGG